MNAKHFNKLVEQSPNEDEHDGYEDPFATFSWQEWLAMQAQTMQRFARFQRAIERREPRQALLIALELQAMALTWQEEAVEWITTPTTP